MLSHQNKQHKNVYFIIIEKIRYIGERLYYMPHDMSPRHTSLPCLET